MSGYLSNTISCSKCLQLISSCICQPGTFTTSVSGTGGVSSGSFSNIMTHTAGWAGSTYNNLFFCATCHQSINQCVCQYNPPYFNPNIQTTPYVIMPTYAPSTTSWTTLTSILSETDNFEVKDTENKVKYKTAPQLVIVHQDDKEGMYVKLNSIEMPILYKECFANLKKTGGYNLWQIRSPLTFRMDIGMKDEKRSPHFLTLASLSNASVYNQDKDAENHQITIAEPHFQEVTDQLELIRLVEIQEVFVQLLRRL